MTLMIWQRLVIPAASGYLKLLNGSEQIIITKSSGIGSIIPLLTLDHLWIRKLSIRLLPPSSYFPDRQGLCCGRPQSHLPGFGSFLVLLKRSL